VIARQGAGLQVDTPQGFSRPRGWIQMSAIQLLTPLPGVTRAQTRRGERLIRGYASAAPTFFTAKNSVETILGSATGLMLGGGAQIVWPNGAFVLGSYERMRKTGNRVLVSGSQVFTLPIDDEVTVTPVSATVGYRSFSSRAFAPYAGVGIGWYRLREFSPAGASEVSKGHVSGHILGGVERRLGPWLSVAGEAQWTAAPKILGETGLSSILEEDDLGGVSVRAKFIIGR
jgi:hypothetical protein